MHILTAKTTGKRIQSILPSRVGVVLVHHFLFFFLTFRSDILVDSGLVALNFQSLRVEGGSASDVNIILFPLENLGVTVGGNDPFPDVGNVVVSAMLTSVFLTVVAAH